jgi:hypothetical protein
MLRPVVADLKRATNQSDVAIDTTTSVVVERLGQRADRGPQAVVPATLKRRRCRWPVAATADSTPSRFAVR